MLDLNGANESTTHPIRNHRDTGPKRPHCRAMRSRCRQNRLHPRGFSLSASALAHRWLARGIGTNYQTTFQTSQDLGKTAGMGNISRSGPSESRMSSSERNMRVAFFLCILIVFFHNLAVKFSSNYLYFN